MPHPAPAAKPFVDTRKKNTQALDGQHRHRHLLLQDVGIYNPSEPAAVRCRSAFLPPISSTFPPPISSTFPPPISSTFPPPISSTFLQPTVPPALLLVPSRPISATALLPSAFLPLTAPPALSLVSSKPRSATALLPSSREPRLTRSKSAAPPPRLQHRHPARPARIGLLLAIDSAFFVIELTVGASRLPSFLSSFPFCYAVHSLALVADAFHMLNDVLSLCVGLWAVRVADTGSSKTYTYGWQRAETLGALVNGVFLVALCMSIFLEAIQRFVEVQKVKNPKLVLIVGCLGLASNILGLLLFHDHSHGDGEGGEHSHAHDPVSHAERGHSHAHAADDVHADANEAGPHAHAHSFTKADEENATLSQRSISISTPNRKSISNGEVPLRHSHRASGSFGRGFGSLDGIHVHPSAFRNEIIQAARLEAQEESEQSAEEDALLDEDGGPNEASNILSNGSPSRKHNYGSLHNRTRSFYDHSRHQHNQPHDAHDAGHGHSHGDLNMRGVFLHVLGDALGNIGVIATALIIWLCSFPGRYYFDPAISLVITAIILWSAIPLCKAASRILLQAVPVGLNIDKIKEDIEDLDRVIECHHLHVWQLSGSKLIASLHVKVDCDIQGSGSASYMHLAREIRQCLHGYGIHSSTIQPEFTSSSADVDAPDAQPDAGGPDSSSAPPTAGSKAASENDCLLDCGDNCAAGKMCCPAPGSENGKGK
ncbi:hypothetical protein DV737_g1086, partial [Chaetothyriales sp. CBS 132003]